MKYRVLVLDIDGTLTNSQKEVTPKTRQALETVQKNGVTVVLASGRPFPGIEPIAKEIGLPEYGGYILSFNGGNISNARDGKVVYQKTLPTPVIPRLTQFAKEHGIGILSYDKEAIVTSDPENPYVQIESRINKMPVRKVEDLSAYLTYPTNKCLMVGDGELMGNLEPVAAKLFPELNIYRSEPYFLECMPQSIDKAHSLEKLLDYLGYTKEQMVACGDGFNDLSMIEYAGLGVAMSNAQPVVKQAADYITGSNDHDGVAMVISRFFDPYQIASV
ncbi:MAG: Cof-type HAD-IIB family hydrolase [Massiliimalia sp.]|jgi:Cof subfamily protein (haloacid dehalogenase superfamily)